MKGSKKGASPEGYFGIISAGSANPHRESSRSRSRTPPVSNAADRGSSSSASSLSTDESISEPPIRLSGQVSQSEDGQALDSRQIVILPRQIKCRRHKGGRSKFKVFVDDQNRPEEASLVCAKCGTTMSLDFPRRLMHYYGSVSEGECERLRHNVSAMIANREQDNDTIRLSNSERVPGRC